MNETEQDSQSGLLGDVVSTPHQDSPSITFDSITFSDGTKIKLDRTDVMVLVGPNNAGKSLALRELDDYIGGNSMTTVFKSIARRNDGTDDDFDAFVRRNVQIKREGSTWSISGYRLSVSTSNLNLKEFWPDNIRRFRSLFCLRVPTEDRINDSNPVDSIDVLEEPVSNPIHMLWDDQLESKLSGYFRRAFDEDLILYRGGGRRPPLLVGERLDPQKGEDRVSASYLRRLVASTVPLHAQGDGMRSFASVILHLLAPITPTVLLLDEPEAFLHPPQARLLGEIIASERSSQAQLFVATHSPDVLHGLIHVASDRLRIVRMQRKGNINHVKELDQELVRKISGDPLMKYSSVMSGVFHQRVIVCEADGDCMFYSSILDLDKVQGEGYPDVLFVHASGKDRMATLAETLRALDVPVDVVADIDILRYESGLQRIVDALGGDWSRIQPVAKIVRAAVDNSKPGLSIDQIKHGVQKALSQELPDSEPEKQLSSSINAVFRRASPWDAVKHYGESAIPQGQATQQFRQLQGLCEEVGLWIVPVGEMEGFCRSVGGHGPSWVQQVIEERDLATDPDLEPARKFVREIWQSRQESPSYPETASNPSN